jgi:hypothetical protein
MTHGAKCFCLAELSFAVQGDCSWSVGEIVGLLFISLPSYLKPKKAYFAFAIFFASNAFTPKPAAPVVSCPGTI